MMTMKDYLQQLGFGLLTSVAIGLLVTAGCNIVIEFHRGSPIFSAWSDYSRGDVMLISGPFALMAVLGIRSILAWAVGICATVAFWGFLYLPDAMEVGGGSNIGFGLLLPLSPIFVFGVAMLGLLPEASRDNR
jgi:hypothetical protein